MKPRAFIVVDRLEGYPPLRSGHCGLAPRPAAATNALTSGTPPRPGRGRGRRRTARKGTSQQPLAATELRDLAAQETLIIDGDLRKPDVHKILDVSTSFGWVNVLSDERNLSEVWAEPFPRLKVAPAGPVPYNPAELLSSNRFAEPISTVTS